MSNDNSVKEAPKVIATNKPTCIADVEKELKAPFNMDELEVRIGEKSKDGTKATVLVYTSSEAIDDRLDRIVGPDNWTIDYIVYPESIKAVLSIFGVPKNAVADFEHSTKQKLEELKHYKAQARSYKRAAAKHGIGRYLWSDSKRVWAELKDDYNFKDSKEALVRKVLDSKFFVEEGTIPGYEDEAPAPQAKISRPTFPKSNPTNTQAAPRTQSDGKPSPAQIGLLKKNSVPNDLIGLISFNDLKGTDKGGGGLIDLIFAEKAKYGKDWNEKTCRVLVQDYLGSDSVKIDDDDSMEVDY